jgi:peptidoglycan/xylan/chitin deacetylase (PgdA/CDA1 family)
MMVPLKRAVAFCLLRSGALAWHRARNERRRAIVLAYHRVNDERDPFFPSLPRRVFADQLDYLAAHYRVQPLEEVAAWLAEGAEGPPRAAITIDDGYPDTLEVALPEIRRRGLPATLFLATAPPETGTPLWTDNTRWMVKHARATEVSVEPLGLRAEPLGGTASRLRILASLLGRLKGCGPAQVDGAVDELRARLDPEGPPLRLLSWGDVRQLAAGGITLGGHTHRHYMVSRLNDEVLRNEIALSIRLIEERVGDRVTSFAYPNGEPSDYDARAISVLRALGLRCAVTCRDGLARPDHDPFQLPRLYTTEPSLALFAARVAGLSQDDAAEVPVS